MNVKSMWGAIFAMVLALGLIPGLAFAATDADLQAAPTQLNAQKSGKDLSNCEVRFTDNQHCGADTDPWQLYFVKGKNVAAEPAFDLILDGEVVDPSNYTIKYMLTWWNDDKDEYKAVSASKLTPSISPDAKNDSMSSEFKIIVKAKKGSDYSGTFENDEFMICVVDWYNVGRFMSVKLPKAKEAWHYAINGMNDNYYVIPQAKAKATMTSLKVIAGEGSHAEALTTSDYKVTYYKARRDAVASGIGNSPEAKVGKALESMPTTAGSYIMIISGKDPYYGKHAILFDIQDKMENVTIAKVKPQTYTGKAIKPKLTVKYNGKKLVEGTDYTVTYKNNKAKGIATATIKGCNKVNTFEYDPSKEEQYRDGTASFIVEKNKQRFFAGSKSVKFTIV